MVTVLLVDDELETLEVIQSYLEMQGFTVWIATDGYKALTLANQHHPTAVLLDVNLQGSPITGLEVLKLLKAQSKAPKVFLITGYDADRYKAEATPLGVDGFLEKPLALNNLVELLKSL
jgi:two-component system nitrogen regulation response regulator NtrX